MIRRGLFMGLNYSGSSHQLNGCINDSINLTEFLVKNGYFEEDELILMNDEKKGTELYPTGDNMWRQLDKLVELANNNQDKQVLLFWAYSGHGSYFYDRNGDENDGRDEVLCPLDCQENGCITDDDLKKYFIDRLTSNVKLFILIDACHSGTMVDLRYNYITDYNYCKFNMYSNVTECEVVMISGCKDSQTSSDAYLFDKENSNYEYQGAMTAAFLNTMQNNISYYSLLVRMRDWLDDKYFSQVPQMSSGRYINVHGDILFVQ